MKQWKKRAAAALTAAFCLLAGCGMLGGAGEEARVDNVKVSDAYFGMAWYQSGVLDPVLDSTGINRLLSEALYEGLFEVTSNFTAENVLCADYTGDGTTFTFTLREDAVFWSGEPLTAADVVDSLQTAQFNEKSPYHNRLVEVSTIEAVSDREVRIRLSSPNINFPRLLDIPIRRASGGSDAGFSAGTGPFRPTEEDRNWYLVPNENWHGGFLGSIRRITLVPLTHADAALSSFQTGDVSLLRAARIATNPPNIGGSVHTVQTEGAVLHYLGINYENSGLAQTHVRQALSAALARQSLCDTQLQTFATPAVLPVNPQPDNTGISLSMAADTNLAQSLLRGGEPAADGQTAEDDTDDPDSGSDPEGDTGDPDEDTGGEDGSGTEDGDGSGETLSFTLLVNADNAFKVAAAEQIASSWNALKGVSVTVDRQPYETFVSRLQSGSFDMYYGETQLTADFDLRPLISSGGSLNYGGYVNEQMSTAVAAARSGENVAALYERFAEELPFIPLAFERGQIIIRKGLIDHYTPAPYNAFAGLEHWTSTD